MRVITIEQKKLLKESDSPIAFILNTPKPDFTQLHKDNLEFAAEIKAEHELLRKKIKELRDEN